jgi:hypothetical protein
MNKIYKLIHNGVVVYVGRTKQTLKKRKSLGYKGCGVESIHKECDIELIEETSDVSRERYWIDYYKDTLLNIQRGDTGLCKKEYGKEYGKEWQKEYDKEWYEANKEKVREYQREYYHKNKWYEANKEKMKKYSKEYYQKKKLKNGQTTNI